MADVLTLRVVGENKMNCGGCERSVTATLRELAGVENVRADHRTQDIQMWFGAEAPTMEQIKRELNDIGYQVEAV